MEILKLKGVILFILTVLNLAFVFFLWRRGRKDKVAFHLGLTTLFSGLYAFTCGITDFLWNVPYSRVLFLNKATWLGVLILPAWLTFVYYFTGRTKYIKLKSFLWYLGAGIISYLALTTSYFIKSIQVKYPYIHEIPGILEPLGRFYILLTLVIGLVYILKEYFKSTGFRKLQIKYFILAVITYSFGGIVFTGILPLVQRKTTYFDLTAIFSLFWVGLTSYAILRYRLMDLRFVLGRTAVYILSFVTVIVIAFLIVFLNLQLGLLLPGNFIWALSLIIAVLFFQPLFRFYEKIASRYFYYTFYSFQMALENLGAKLNTVIELTELINLINRTLLNALNLDRIGIILKRPDTKTFEPGTLIKFAETDISSLLAKEDQFLLQYLIQNKKPLVREEIPSVIEEIKEKFEEKRKLLIFKEDMERLKIGILLPLMFGEELIGLIISGDKFSAEPYNQQELKLLAIFSSQAAVAINNVLEIEKRKAELEKFYKIAVGRELRMVELKKKIKELEERYKK